MENRRYGILLDGNIQFAPRVFFENGSIVVPREDDDQEYFKHGWQLIVRNPPKIDENQQMVVLIGYEQGSGVINAVYEVRDIPDEMKPQKKYSKLKITLFAMNVGLWNSIKEWLQEIGYYDLFVMAQYFLSSDQYFVQAIQMFKEKFRDVVEGEMAQDIDELVDNMLEFSFDGILQPGEK